MKSLCLIHRSIGNQRKLTEHEYDKHRPRTVLFSEHVYFVQICPVFAGPVTYIETSLMGAICMHFINHKLLVSR